MNNSISDLQGGKRKRKYCGGWFYLLSFLGTINASCFLASGQILKYIYSYIYSFFMCEEMFMCLKINYNSF